ncbi:MAG: polyribonucleotide nucleotidyltransferase, partial [Bacteroidetes bacterium]|nr:polyribonucleotide nucleotidyltransferase [Bacteroidota bacterium]
MRVARIDGKFSVNPSYTELKKADIDMIIAGTVDNILMVEGEMKEVSEDEMVEAISLAQMAIAVQCNAQIELAAQVEKAKTKREYSHETHDVDLKKQIHDYAFEKYKEIARQASAKEVRSAAFKAVQEEFVATLTEERIGEVGKLIGAYFGKVKKDAVRRVMLDEGIRL